MSGSDEEGRGELIPFLSVRERMRCRASLVTGDSCRPEITIRPTDNAPYPVRLLLQKLSGDNSRKRRFPLTPYADSLRPLPMQTTKTKREGHFCIVGTAHPDKRETIGDLLRKGKHLYISNPPYDCFPLPQRPLNQLQRIIWFSICRQLTSNQALLGLQGMLSCRPTNARLHHNQAPFKIRRTLR